MGYKVEISVLEKFKKEFESTNKILENLKNELNDVGQETVQRQIKKNEKQIKILENEYYIGQKSDND